MADLPLAGEFEQFEMADKVAMAVGARILDRIAHPGLGAEMDDSVDLDVTDGGGKGRLIGKIDGMKNKIRVRADQPGQARCFQRNWIIIIKIVDADDPFAACQQGADNMCANEAGSPGDQHRHGIEPQ